MPNNRPENTNPTLQNGNTHDWNELSEFLNETLISLAIYFINDPVEAEKIAGDVFCKFWPRQHEYDSIEDIKSLMFVSTRNACLNFLRYKRSQAKRIKKYNYSQADIQEENKLQEMIRQDMRTALLHEIEKIPVKARKVFKLFYIDGLSVEDIARQEKKGIQTVINQKNNALKQLRKILATKKGPKNFLF